jgi:hypothetical protein
MNPQRALLPRFQHHTELLRVYCLYVKTLENTLALVLIGEEHVHVSHFSNLVGPIDLLPAVRLLMRPLLYL